MSSPNLFGGFQIHGGSKCKNTLNNGDVVYKDKSIIAVYSYNLRIPLGY